MNQHVTKVEHIDPETGEITEVSLPASEPTQIEAPAAEVASVEAEPKSAFVKRTFPLQPVVEAPKPKLPTPAADRIDPKWDIARVANRGAMHLERVFVMSEKMLWPSILMALLAVSLIFYAAMSGSPGALTSFIGHGPDSGMGRLLIMFLPFFIVGVAMTALVLTYLNMSIDDGYLLVGGLTFGIPLALLWYGAASDPNGALAWILFGAKTVIAITLVLWIGSHIRKIRKVGESKAVLWMVGVYVGVVVIASVVLTSLGTALSGFAPGGMQTISAMLTFNRDTYFDLGGGLRSGPEYRWLGEYAPEGGLSVAKLNALIASVRSDYGKLSKDAANWEEVTKLDPQPMRTRPEKALRDNAKELPNGIVVVPEGEGPVSIIAHVEGQWSITVIAPFDCAVVLGPFDPASGCQNATTPKEPMNPYVSQILNSLKPTPAALQK